MLSKARHRRDAIRAEKERLAGLRRNVHAASVIQRAFRRFKAAGGRAAAARRAEEAAAKAPPDRRRVQAKGRPAPGKVKPKQRSKGAGGKGGGGKGGGGKSGGGKGGGGKSTSPAPLAPLKHRSTARPQVGILPLVSLGIPPCPLASPTRACTKGGQTSTNARGANGHRSGCPTPIAGASRLGRQHQVHAPDAVSEPSRTRTRQAPLTVPSQDGPCKAPGRWLGPVAARHRQAVAGALRGRRLGAGLSPWLCAALRPFTSVRAART